MSDTRQDFLNIAMSHKGEGGSWAWSTSGLGSGNAWCAAFVIACAKTAGNNVLGTAIYGGTFMAGLLVQESVNRGMGTYQLGGHNGGNPSPAAGDLLTYNNGSPTSGSGVFAAQHIGIVYAVNGSQVTTIEGNTSGGIVDSHKIQSNASNVAVFYRPNWAKVGGSTSGNVGDGSGYTYTKYTLSDSDLTFIAWVCQQEQGTVTGSKAEASLIANKWELLTDSYRSKWSSMAAYVRGSGWWATRSVSSVGSVRSDVLAGVKDVLVNGNRTLPTCIDEHDSISDIGWIKTNGVYGTPSNRSDYVSCQTIVHNTIGNGGSSWTFYCFPDSTSDPFGYTDSAYEKCGGIVMGGTAGDGSYVLGGDLYDTITTRADSIIREVGYWGTSNSLTTSSTKIRCSVINYTTQLGAFFKGAVSNGYSDSSMVGSSVDTSGVNNTNLRAILDELFNLGYSTAAACGICGNIQQESSFNPGAVSKATHTSSYGLCQWTDDTRTGMDRGTKMINAVGSNWATNISGQVQYLDSDLRGGYQSVYSQLCSCADTLDGALEAMEAFLRGFEAPNYIETEIQRRTPYTTEIWNMLVTQV